VVAAVSTSADTAGRLRRSLHDKKGFFGPENPAAYKDAAVKLWTGGESAQPDKHTSMRFAWRGFISTAMTDGIWLDVACSDTSVVHEYVGHSPRIANPMGDECFRTDSRGYSTAWDARARHNHKITISGTSVSVDKYSDETKFFKCTKPGLLAAISKKCGDVLCAKTSGSDALVTESVSCYDGTKWVDGCTGGTDPWKIVYMRISGAPGDPCTPPGTPKIDFYGRLTIFPTKGRVVVDGAYDDFPWFEAVAFDGTSATGTSLFTLDPKPGATVFSLFGGTTRNIKFDKRF